MRDIKQSIKALLPASQVLRINGIRSAVRRWRNARKPATTIFDDIYENGRWGGSREDPCSGAGSRGPLVDAYIMEVAKFIAAIQARSILDIGCGDFHVGKRLLNELSGSVSYTGLDVSSIVVAHNRQHYSAPNINFICGDACEMDLPIADVCLVRQVLQHLSNEQISLICRKFGGYRHVIVTEHVPEGHFLPNKNKPQGADIRLNDNSGICLDQPPFSLTGVSTLLDVAAKPGDAGWGRLVTVVIKSQGNTTP